MLKQLRGIALVALAVTLTATTACSSNNSATPAPDNANKEPDKVTYVTAFGAVGRDAFAWVAQDQGFFKEAKLDVTIQLGAAVDQNLTALASGQAQFAALD